MNRSNHVWHFCFSALLLTAASTARAVDYTWTGQGGDTLWANAANWENNAAPVGSDDIAIFPAGTPTAVTVGANATIKTIYFRNPGTTLTVASGANLHFDNLGSLTIRAEEDAVIEGPGTLSFSTNTGENYADNQAYSGKTLTINAKIVNTTGFEHNGTGGGVIVLANTANEYTGNTLITAAGTLSVSTVSNSGAPSTLGTGNAFKFSTGSTAFRYTGTGDTTDRTFYQNAAAGADVSIEHTGSGTLTFTGPFLSGNNNGHAFIFTVTNDATIRNTGLIENGGTGGLWLYKRGAGTHVLTAANTFTGNTVLDEGTLALAGDGAISAGSLLRMRGGRLLFNAETPVANYTAAIGTLQIEGFGSILEAAADAEITIAQITHLSGALDFIGTGLGTTTKIFIDGQPDGLIGPWATANGVPAAYSQAQGVYVPALSTQDLTALGPSTILDNAFSTAHITAPGISGGIILGSAVTEIALLSQETATAATVTLGGQTLVAPQIQITAGSGDLAIGALADTGTLTINADQTGSLILDNAEDAATLTVRATIQDNADTPLYIEKTGPGSVILAGDLDYTGRTVIDTGTLTLDVPLGSTRSLATSAISGNGNLAFTGGGTLAMPNVANSYTGLTTVANGIVRALHNTTFGTTASPTVIEDNGAIDFIGSGANTLNHGQEHFYAQGDGPDGLGALRNTGAYSQYSALVLLTLTDDIAVYTPQRLDLRGANSYLNLNGHGITKRGYELFGLTNTTVTNDQDTAFIDVLERGFTMEVDASLSGGDANIIRVYEGAYFDLYNLTHPINWKMEFAPNSRLYTRYGNTVGRNAIAGPVSLAGRFTLDSAASVNDTISGRIIGSGPLAKIGGADSVTYLLNENNDWTGGTVVSNGILYVAAPGSLPGYATDVSVLGTGGLTFRVAGSDPEETGWSTTQIDNILNNGTTFQSTAAYVGFDTLYADLDYHADLPHVGVRKFGTHSLTLSGSGANLSGIVVQGGTLDLGTIARDLGDNSVRVGVNTPATEPPAALILRDTATVTTFDRGYNIAGQPSVTIGDSGRGTLDISGDAAINGKLMVGNAAGSAGAVYQTSGDLHNTGGANNDGRIGMTGYGYYLLAGGTHTTEGYSQLGRDAAGVGILEQTGGSFTFTGTYSGNFGISRGGTGMYHLSGGTFTQPSSLRIGDSSDNGLLNGHATVTLDGDATITVAGNVDIANRTNMTAILNLNGGTLEARAITRGNYPGTEAFVNWNGGLLRSTAIADSQLITQGNSLYPDVTIHSGGATIEIPENRIHTVRAPLLTPEKLGLTSIPLATSGTGYIGAPFVKIEGGNGSGASAFARFDRASGTLTGIDILSPGSGYTHTPTVTLVGGGADEPATLGTPTLGIVPSGGLTKLGPGTLTLEGASTYTGPTEVREGTLRLAGPDSIPPRSDIIVDGGTLDLNGHTLANENLTIRSGTVSNGRLAATTLEKNDDGTLTISTPISTGPRTAVIRPATPGLWEGRIDGSAYQTNGVNPRTGIQLTPRAANGSCASGGSIGGAHWPDYSTYVYTGYIWNRSPTNETWTFAEQFDDFAMLDIDGKVVLHNNGWNTPTKGTITVTPGPHHFEARFGQGGSGAGGNVAGWWTSADFAFLVDFQGRDSEEFGNYEILRDPGDGSRLTIDLPITRGPGLTESVIYEAWNIIDDGEPTSTQLTPRAGNGTITHNSRHHSGLWIGNNHTWIYKGVIWNRGDTDKTWTWRFDFDDNVMLTIDGILVSNVNLSAGTVFQDHTLTPGPHDIEIRFGDGSGNVGPNKDRGGLGGLTYDPNGGGASSDIANFILLEDPGDGSLLTTDIESGLTPELAIVNVNAGTLRLDRPQSLPGLYEGSLKGARNWFSPNPATTVQTTTRAVNGNCGVDGYINGALWPSNTTYIYTGYIWNRSDTDQTWTFAENFDDCAFLAIDGAIVLENDGWNTVTKGTITVAPGPHRFEARFGQGTGGAAGNVSGWWTDGNRSFMVDLDGRDSTTFSDYTLLEDPGDGSLLSTELFDPLLSEGLLDTAAVNLASGATLDLNNAAHTVALITGDGTVANGTLAAGTVISPAGDDAIGTLTVNNVAFAQGTTYRVTVDGDQCDVLTSSDALDISGMTVIPATDTMPTKDRYVIGHAEGGFTGKRPAYSGFPLKYAVVPKGNELLLCEMGTLILLK